MRPVSYQWIDTNTRQDTFYGFIAQDVKQTYEKYVDSFAGWRLGDSNDTNSTQSLCYTEFIAPIVKSIQELAVENTDLKNTTSLQQDKLNKLQQTVEVLQNENETLKQTLALFATRLDALEKSQI